jgi:CRISPR/Cas system-associated exonuclease Cas4 (RecB family)
MNRMVTTISASKLNMFLDCRREYWYRYIKKEPVSTETNLAFLKGKLVHESLRTYLGGGAKQMIDCLNLAMKVAEEPPSKEMVTKALSILEGWQRNYQARGEIVGLEWDFTLNLGGVSVRGIVDKIEKVGNIYYITDYKTGFTKYTRDDIAESIQLVLYAMAIHETWQDCEEVIGVYDMVEQGITVEAPITADSIRTMHMYIKALSESIEQMPVSTPSRGTPGMHCAYCAYKYKCEEYKAYLQNDIGIEIGDVTDIGLITKNFVEVREKIKVLEATESKLSELLKHNMQQTDCEQIDINNFKVTLSQGKRTYYDPTIIFSLMPEDFFRVCSVKTEEVDKLRHKLDDAQKNALDCAKRVSSSYPILKVSKKSTKRLD